MDRFILFVKKIYVLLLFIILEVVALNFYANSTSYTRAILLTWSNSVALSLYDATSSVSNYLRLSQDNKELIEEVAQLRNQLELSRKLLSELDTSSWEDIGIDSIGVEYDYTAAEVVRNTISRQYNYMTINKGSRDGVVPNTAILSPNGALLGYILTCSDKFSVGISILNKDFRGSGRIGNSDWYGPIHWDGANHEIVELTDIPKYAQLNRGDTIYTTKFSSIFPPDMTIGVIDSYELDASMLYRIKVRLFQHMAALNKVLLVKYNDAEERFELESKFE